MPERKTPSRLRWYLYDAGNTIVELSVSLYLVVFLTAGGRTDPRSVGAIYAGSTWLATFFGLALGSHIDRTRNVMGPLKLLTVLSAAAICLISVIPPRFTTLLLTSAFIGNFAFVLAVLAYTSMMRSVAGSASLLSVSGRGVAASYIGGLCAVLIWIAIERSLLHPSARTFTFLFSGLAYLLFALPLLFQGAPPPSPVVASAAPAHRLVDRHTLWYLLGVLLMTAGLHGTALNVVSFLSKTQHVSQSKAQTIWIVGVAAVVIGAGLVGLVGKRIARSSVAAFAVAIGTWVACLAILWRSSGIGTLIIAIVVAGACSGFILSTLRGLFAGITSESRQGAGFGAYFVFQRIGQGIGPLVWTLADARRADTSLSPLLMALLGAGSLLMFGLAKKQIWKRS
jgi:MFS-type transporter involved in bile tolerance (Atg22 family)